MKPCNIVKQFGNGWVVGLSASNRVLVETPAGEVVEPYEGPGKQLFGTVVGDETIKIDDREVCEVVRHLWERQTLAEEQARAAGEFISESENELPDFDAPTLEDLGFEGGSVRIEEI